MAQRIQQMGEVPYARESMTFSSLQQGLGAMSPPNQGMSNMMDGGLSSKPNANAQVQRQADLQLQNIQQNTMSAASQSVAGMQGQLIKEETEMATAESAQKQFMNRYLANVMDANELTKGMTALNAQMDGPNRMQFMQNIEISKAMGESPDLGALVAEANQYD